MPSTDRVNSVDEFIQCLSLDRPTVILCLFKLGIQAVSTVWIVAAGDQQNVSVESSEQAVAMATSPQFRKSGYSGHASKVRKSKLHGDDRGVLDTWWWTDGRTQGRKDRWNGMEWMRPDDSLATHKHHVGCFSTNQWLVLYGQWPIIRRTKK